MGIGKYVIITPAHNEECYIGCTLDSVAGQTMHPSQWILVDDGSIDGTAAIVQGYADKYPGIKLVRYSPPEAGRQAGAKIIRAFLCGYRALDVLDYEFIVKLDADLTLSPDYFEDVGGAFDSDPAVGLCGGYMTALIDGTWKKERNASYHLRGPIQAYRKQCFDQIGGIPAVSNSDFIAEMKAMSLGWEVKILPLEVRHNRRTSTLINRGLWSSYEMGEVLYRDGYDLLLTLLRSFIYGLSARPYILSAICLVSGFLASSLTRPAKDVDTELETFIRGFQYKRIRRFLQRSALYKKPTH